MARITISQLKEPGMQGKELVEMFAIRKIELKTKESDGKAYLSLEFGDATGRMDGVLWNEAEEAYRQLSPGDVAQAKVTVGKYRDNVQLRVDNIRRCRREEYLLSDYLASSALSRVDLEAEIRAESAGVRDTHLVKLLRLFWDDSTFLKEFFEAPAAKLWHHAWVGGLAEHTLAVCRLARAALKNYQRLDPDLLITGCLLHDIGKVKEFSLGTVIDYSDQGRLMGHLVLGDQMLMEKVSRIRDFPLEKSMRLRHILLSHHGEKDKGSPVVPCTLEALVVHHCDFMDSHAAAYQRIIGREEGRQKRWSEYVNLIDRYIYLGEGDGQTDDLTLL